MTMAVLVTGGGGFIGRRLAQRLARDGEVVRTFARGAYPDLSSFGIEHFRGDIRDPDALRKAAAGCEVVYHVAAKVGIAGSKDSFVEVNVGGTQNVIDACREEGVGRLVFTSSPSVVIGEEDIEGVDESHPYPDSYAAFYPETKAEAERRVLAAHGHNLKTVSLRPHVVWGPGDTSLLPRLLQRASRLRRIGPGGKRTDVTFIDDAVEAHVLAARALEAAPETVGAKVYFISSGEPVEIWTFVDGLLHASGRPKLSRSISLGTARFAARTAETVHRWTGGKGEPVLSRWIVHELTHSHWFDISAARRDLGYSPQVDLEEGLARLKAWFEAGEPVT